MRHLDATNYIYTVYRVSALYGCAFGRGEETVLNEKNKKNKKQNKTCKTEVQYASHMQNPHYCIVRTWKERMLDLHRWLFAVQ